jgi:hypothetical protein
MLCLRGQGKGVADRDSPFGALVYLAWAVTRKKEIAAHVGVLEDGVLKSRSAVKASKQPLIGPGTTEEAEEARHILPGTSAEAHNTRESAAARCCPFAFVESCLNPSKGWFSTRQYPDRTLETPPASWHRITPGSLPLPNERIGQSAAAAAKR